MFIHLFVLSSLASFSTVYGRHNITVDDRDPSIIYTPANAWTLSANSTLNAGGAHMLTQNPTGAATFTFTGVAIYFMSPKWPYLVNTAISLDSGQPVLVDLVDHSRSGTVEGQETVQSQVVWGTGGLPNTQHKLVMSVGTGQSFAIVDTLIYTVLDPQDIESSSSSTSASAPSITSTHISTSNPPSPTSISTGATSSSSKRVLSIALGTIFGVLALLLIAVAFWFCARRRRRPVSEAWTVAGHPYPSNSETNVVPIAGSPGVHNYYNQPYNPFGYGPGGPVTTPAPGVAPMSHPYANATGVVYGQGPQQSYNPWPLPMPQQHIRAPNRYQPNTLSTITETSTPPVGSGTPLAYSPSSPGTELYHSAASSLPSDSPYAGGSGGLPGPQDLGRPLDKLTSRNPPVYTPN